MRILLISHFGALFPAEYLYKYLVKQNHSVVSVGRIFKSNMPEYMTAVNRQGSTHLPLFWREKLNKNNMPVWTIDVQVIFEMLGHEWDAIIECECYNLQTEDHFDLIDKMFDIPYFFWKTQYLEDYVPGHATHIFYAADLIKEKLLKDGPEWNLYYDDNIENDPEDTMTYLPLTVDPEIVKDYCPDEEPIWEVFFAGQVPDGDYLPKFEKAYDMRKQVVRHLGKELNGDFVHCEIRQWEHIDYLKKMSKARILLNIGIGGLNLRDFEAMAMGKPLVTWDNNEYFRNAFTCGITYEPFSNKESALRNVKHLIKYPEQAKTMGKLAKKFFDIRHHPNKRIEVIIEAIKNAKA